MEKIEDKERPICSCGEKMSLVKYTGYYDEFNYWICDKCSLDDKIQNTKEDFNERGSYA